MLSLKTYRLVYTSLKSLTPSHYIACEMVKELYLCPSTDALNDKAEDVYIDPKTDVTRYDFFSRIQINLNPCNLRS